VPTSRPADQPTSRPTAPGPAVLTSAGVYLEYGNNLSSEMKKEIDKAFNEPLLKGKFYKKG
jgi:hypothetical protein